MSKNGVFKTTPFLTMRIRPARSTTNSLPLPSRAVATWLGRVKPPIGFESEIWGQVCASAGLEQREISVTIATTIVPSALMPSCLSVFMVAFYYLLQNWNRIPTSISRGEDALKDLPKNGEVSTPLGVPG